MQKLWAQMDAISGATIATATGGIGGDEIGLAIRNATAGGTTLTGSDYTATSGILSFAAGQSAQTIIVATIGDAFHESPETMSVNLSAPTGGAQILTATGTGTIIDND